MNKQIHKESALKKYSKKELINHCIDLEHNLDALKKTFEVQYQNCMNMIADMNILNNTMKKVMEKSNETNTI